MSDFGAGETLILAWDCNTPGPGRRQGAKGVPRRGWRGEVVRMGGAAEGWRGGGRGWA
jgi:hypothetical protein